MERTGGLSGSVARESSWVRVSLTPVVIGCHPSMNAQIEIERLESSTGGTVELCDGFVEIHLPLQLDGARILECLQFDRIRSIVARNSPNPSSVHEMEEGS